MSLLSRLFGGASAPEPQPEPELYKDFRIFVEPEKAPGGFRLGARIEKEIDGALRSHRLIRADTFDSAETAHEMTLAKARLLIDQQGDTLFD
jgi:hypothetical protein